MFFQFVQFNIIKNSHCNTILTDVPTTLLSPLFKPQIQVSLRVNQSAGLGSASGVALSLDHVADADKTKRWNKAQQRFHQSSGATPTNVSNLSSSHEPTQYANSNPTSNLNFSQKTAVLKSGAKQTSKPKIVWLKGDTQYNDAMNIQHNDTQSKDSIHTQHNDTIHIQHNDTIHTQHNDTQHKDIQDSETHSSVIHQSESHEENVCGKQTQKSSETAAKLHDPL